MTPAEPPQVGSVALAALERVLDVEPDSVRADTPLASLGWDSLARLCWEDVMAEFGAAVELASPVVTVGDLIAASPQMPS